jgi:outer membrane lipoprotein LolB
MKNIFRITIFLLFVTSCTSTPPVPEQQAEKMKQERDKLLLGIDNWKLNATLSLTTKKEKQSLNLIWIQDQENQNIYLSSFGTMVLSFTADKTKAYATTKDGKKVTAKTAKELVYKMTGFSIPIKKLQHWMFARVFQNDKYSFDKDGFIKKIKDDKAQVFFSDYEMVDNVIMPMYIRFVSYDMSITFDIDKWHLNDIPQKQKNIIPLMGI